LGSDVKPTDLGSDVKPAGLSGEPEDAEKFHLRCYDSKEEYTTPLFYALSWDWTHTPPSNPTTAKSIHPLIVSFYGSPKNLLSPAWWLDGTDYKSQKFDVSDAMPSKPANHTDGSVGLGWMNFTSTSTDNQVYSWQSKSSDTETNITVSPQ
jgi:hypothetical protein